jgi:predicted oxidoreductase
LKRTSRPALRINTEHAAHALRLLIADGKIAATDISNVLKRREQMIRDLRQRLAALEQGAVSAMRRTGIRMARKVNRKPKRKMTAARRAALKLHGQYLGTVRPLSKANRAKIKAIRAESGARAAIVAARKMAK